MSISLVSYFIKQITELIYINGVTLARAEGNSKIFCGCYLMIDDLNR